MARNYNQYQTIQARFDSQGTCGHAIRKGDPIGYSPKRNRSDSAETQCAECWRAWTNDVVNETEYMEAYGGCL